MKEKEKALFLPLVVVGLTVLGFGLTVAFIIHELVKGDAVASIVMMFLWLPCTGLVILEILIYLYGIYCRKTKWQEALKMFNSTCIFGILVSGYMIAVSLVFLYTKFEQYKFYLIVLILAIANMVYSMLIKKKIRNSNNV